MKSSLVLLVLGIGICHSMTGFGQVFQCELSSCTYAPCTMEIDTNVPRENYGMAFWAEAESSFSIHCEVDDPRRIACQFIQRVDSATDIVSSFEEPANSLAFSHHQKRPSLGNEPTLTYRFYCKRQP